MSKKDNQKNALLFAAKGYMRKGAVSKHPITDDEVELMFEYLEGHLTPTQVGFALQEAGVLKSRHANHRILSTLVAAYRLGRLKQD